MMPIDPELKALVEAMKAAGMPKIGTIPVDMARALFRVPPVPVQDGVSVEETAVPRGDGGAVPIRIYRPGKTMRGIILYYHGGGWVIGTLDDIDPTVRHIAAETGCAVISVDYRLAPEHRFPAAVDDAWAALEWAARPQQRKALAGVENVPLFVMGDSAGGNLAAALSILARDAGGPDIAMQLLLYPVTEGDADMPDMHAFVPPLLEREEIIWFFDQYIALESRQDPRFSPGRVEDCAGLAPAFIATAGYDLLAAQATRFGDRLSAAGVPVTLRHYSEAVHGFMTTVPLTSIGQRAMSEAVAAINGVVSE